MRTHNRSRGFTLIEMLVSVALLGVVVFYIMGTFVVNQKAYMVLDQVMEVQQSSRAVADLIEKDMRHAGFLVPTSAAICGVDNTAAPDALYMSDADPLLSANAILGDLVSTVTATAGTTNITIIVDDVVLDGTAFYDTNGDAVPDADFQIGGGIIVTDTRNPDRGSMCGTITAINFTTDTITFNRVSGALAAVAGGTLTTLVAVPAHEYAVNVGTTELLRNNMVLARGVEDLQFALWVDGNFNNQPDVNEYLGDGIAANYVASTFDHSDSREMRVSLVTRTRSSDVDFARGQAQMTENRVAVPGNDGFRRRVHTSRARLRNVANRS